MFNVALKLQNVAVNPAEEGLSNRGTGLGAVWAAIGLPWAARYWAHGSEGWLAFVVLVVEDEL